MINQVLKDLVRFEGYSPKPYLCPTGKITIGYGRNLENNGISKKEAEILLFFDVKNVIAQLDRKLNFWIKQPAAVRIVLMQMAFQLGVNGLLSFQKFISALMSSEYEKAIDEMKDSIWAKQTPERVIKLSEYLKNIDKYEHLKKYQNENIRMLNEIENNITSFSLFE